MGGRAASLEQARLREQEGAHAHGADAAHLVRHLPSHAESAASRRRPAGQAADQEHGVAGAFDLVEVMLGDEGEHAAFPGDGRSSAFVTTSIE
jgi:hypothetical protein